MVVGRFAHCTVELGGVVTHHNANGRVRVVDGVPDDLGARLRRACVVALAPGTESCAQIAEQRGLTTQTVEGHLAFFVKTGELAIDGLLPADRLREIEERIANIQARSIKDLKIALGDDFSYGEINLMLAHLEHRNNQ